MTKPNDDIPAFPVPTISGPDLEVSYPPHVRGMTLRDWFAGQAMAAMVNSYRTVLRGHDDADDERDGDFVRPHREMILDKNTITGEMDGSTEIAEDAYAIADAMLAAREAR